LRQQRDALRARGIRSLPFRRHRFYLNSLQSALFNHYLTERLQRGLLDDVLPGDVVKKHATGGIFTVEDVAAERPRAQRWEISATGPIYGSKMLPAQGEAAELEAAVLAEAGLTLGPYAGGIPPGEAQRLPPARALPARGSRLAHGR
jgi:tRNA(Glu) U13 pseudouridine synthase TruD